jgi:hypothetical protein
MNRRHMTGNHHGRTARRATLVVTATDEILGTHSSETFGTWWAAHNVWLHRTGVKHLDPGPPRRSLPVSGLPVLSQQASDG